MEAGLSQPLEFSVIISVYNGDRSDWLEAALLSVIDQTVRPNEILITIDGSINNQLQATIDSVIRSTPNIDFRIVGTQRNRGRGTLLALAVEGARHEVVAIMDADDVALPKRFEKQLQVFSASPEIDVVGGWIAEFESQPDQLLCVRRLPEWHADIVKYARWRNPINQMTVMFKKSAVIEVGNYQELKFFEDMWLWYRLLHSGYQFYNIPETLVLARGGENIVSRRTGLKYIKHEVRLLLKLLNAGIINKWEFVTMVFTRLPVRLLPGGLARRFIFRFLRSR